MPAILVVRIIFGVHALITDAAPALCKSRLSELVSRVPQAQTMDDWMAHPTGPESTAAIFTRRGLQAFAGEAALPGCAM